MSFYTIEYTHTYGCTATTSFDTVTASSESQARSEFSPDQQHDSFVIESVKQLM
jgi:hypothetical protein